MHQSIATIDSPEFINLQPLDINPLMSSCEIKVLYVGENRNKTFISKEVAQEMAKTLRGAPIVGYFRKDTEDFGDHGERVIIESDGEIKFETLTIPYGFVAPDAKIWFKKFKDIDVLGNEVEREYLMTTGYLWTGQFEEAKKALEFEGKGQSMEFDDETFKGEWATNYKTGAKFFIISDAIFSKLCILGDDTEPCFEGAKISTPEVSTNFSHKNNFVQTLYSMMQDLKDALEGGQTMKKEIESVENISTIQDNGEQPVIDKNEETTEDITSIEAGTGEGEATSEEGETPVQAEAEPIDNPVEGETPEGEAAEGEQAPTEYANKCESEEEDKEKEKDSKEDKEEEDKDEKEKNKYSLLLAEHEELKTKFAELTANYEALVEYKRAVEDVKKDEMIKSFYMLDDEDKKEIIENKSKYSLDEIESKLSILYTRKSLESEMSKEAQQKDTSLYTYNLNDDAAASIPAWAKRACEVQDKMNCE